MVSLRELKEAFVAGHAGTSPREVSALASAPVALLLLWRLVQNPATGGAGLFHRARPSSAALAVEWAVLVLPLVAALLGLISPAKLLGSAIALAAALFATQPSSEWQQRGKAARRRPPTELLR